MSTKSLQEIFLTGAAADIPAITPLHGHDSALIAAVLQPALHGRTRIGSDSKLADSPATFGSAKVLRQKVTVHKAHTTRTKPTGARRIQTDAATSERTFENGQPSTRMPSPWIAEAFGDKTLLKEQEMNWDQIKGKWKQAKGQIQAKWGDLTDDDLDRINGKREELVGKVQEKYGVARDEAEQQVREFETSCNC